MVEFLFCCCCDLCVIVDEFFLRSRIGNTSLVGIVRRYDNEMQLTGSDFANCLPGSYYLKKDFPWFFSPLASYRHRHIS